MTRLAGALLVAAALGCAPAPAPSAAEVKRAYLQELGDAERVVMGKVARGFVRIEGPQGDGGGMAIASDGKVLTAWHVVDGTFMSYSRDGGPPQERSRCTGTYQGKPFATLRLVAACPDQDLAVVDIGMATPDHVVPSTRGVALGERVFLLGAAMGGPEQFTECTAMKCTPDKGSLVILMNAPAFPGDSGGGVVNARGELLGILVKAGSRPIREPSLPGWSWVSLMIPTPSQVVAEILAARSPGRRSRLVFDPEPPEGRLDPEKVWGTIHLKFD